MITDSLSTPTLIIDPARCRANARTMLAKAQKHGMRLRPHFKTHQSLEVGRWLREEGVAHATVSSITMARYFALEWEDITVAFPFNMHEMEQVKALANQITLGLTVENPEALQVLAEQLEKPVRIWVKVDAGYHRTGVPVQDLEMIRSLLRTAQAHEHMTPAGVIIHGGHSYDVHTHEAIEAIHLATLGGIALLRQALSVEFPGLEYSLGDTPACSTQNHFAGATEMRPGNFIFYDVMQHYIGSNALDQISVCMACPVVAKHPERNQVVVYGGGVHFSKDSTIDHTVPGGRKVMGLPVSFTEDGWGPVWNDSWVLKLSQEHGILQVPTDRLNQIAIGDWIGILPVHSCLTADLMGHYKTLDGEPVDHLREHRFV